MKILYIDHYVGSVYHGMEFRPYYLSREWIKSGHEVVIVGASFSHLRQKNIEMTQDILEENIDGIRYVWLKTPEYKGNGIGRIKNMLTFLYKLYKYLPKISKDFVPDAVIASSTYPLDSYPANRIAKKHKAKFVFEMHDLWPMSPMVFGKMSKWHPFIMLMQMGEDYWCKNTDIVISLWPDAYKHLCERGMNRGKYFAVPNGVDLAEWNTEHRISISQLHREFLAKLKKDNKFIVAYTGGLVVSNYLHLIVEIANKLKENCNIHFLLIGKGPEENKLRNLIESYKLTNISILPPVEKRAVPDLFERIDLFVRFTLGSELEKYGSSPNKIFDYMMAAKPVLWTHSEDDNWISNAKCGITLKRFDLDIAVAKILEIYNMETQEVQKMGENGKRFIIANNTYPVLADKFIKAIEGEIKND